MTNSESPRLTIVGAGKMGSTLISSLLADGQWSPKSLCATGRRDEPLTDLNERYGVRTAKSNVEAVRGARGVLVCVKPQAIDEVVREIAPALDDDAVVVSIAAGVTLSRIEAALGREIAAIRAMPNTPSLIGSGMTALSAGRHVQPEQLELAQEIFATTGRVVTLDERYFDAVTGLSASGPAFVYIIIEALAEGGVKAGLPRQVATELAAQTCLGASRMVLETGHHPALLKDDVTTPGGCTMDGILMLEEGGLRVTLIKAIVEAKRRAAELGETSSGQESTAAS